VRGIGGRSLEGINGWLNGGGGRGVKRWIKELRKELVDGGGNE